MLGRIEYALAVLFVLACSGAYFLFLFLVGYVAYFFLCIGLDALSNGTRAQRLARKKENMQRSYRAGSWEALCGKLYSPTDRYPPVPPDYEMKPDEIKKMERDIAAIRIRNR